MRKPPKLRSRASTCYGCGLAFTPGEGRAAEVLCRGCQPKEPNEVQDAHGLPSTFKPFTPRVHRRTA